jgi:adenylate kinase
VNQHVYHIRANPPKVSGVCDFDGSGLYQRSDDTGEAVQKRLGIFFNETIQLLDYYGGQQELREVNGNVPIDQTQRMLLNEIHDHQDSRQ